MKQTKKEKDILKKKSDDSGFDENKPCYCNLCERTYKNYARFRIHMKKHYG